jgi:secreted PhoX family phosphatase
VNLVGTPQRRGPGIVYFSVAAAPDGGRAGLVQIAGREFTIRQARRDTSSVQALTPTVSTLAGDGTRGARTDPGPARSAQFASISGIAFDNRGNLYISDAEQHIIRRVRADGIIELWAGIVGIPAFTGDGGPAIQARLNEPEGLAVDTAGNLYVADKGNRRIRRITPEGIISTIAGTGIVGQEGDGEAALRATFRELANLLIDNAGNLLIADRSGNRIRRVAAGTGIITTIAGTGQSAFSGIFRRRRPGNRRPHSQPVWYGDRFARAALLRRSA